MGRANPGQPFLVSFKGAGGVFDSARGNDVVLRAVPEPNSFVLIGAALGAVVAVRAPVAPVTRLC